MERKPLKRVPTAVVLIILFAGGATGVGAFSLISVDQEVQIGRQAQAEIRQQVPEVRDRVVTAYIQNLGRTIAAQADGPRYPYSFPVANAREINAFALPGGPVWVHRGAILAAQNESQLAAIMAHEIAHIANRHAADRVSQTLAANVGLSLLDALLGNGRRAQIAEIGALVGANAAMAKFSRDDEREADEQGMLYMRRAGFDPGGMAELMRLLRAQQRRIRARSRLSSPRTRRRPIGSHGSTPPSEGSEPRAGATRADSGPPRRALRISDPWPRSAADSQHAGCKKIAGSAPSGVSLMGP